MSEQESIQFLWDCLENQPRSISITDVQGMHGCLYELLPYKWVTYLHHGLQYGNYLWDSETARLVLEQLGFSNFPEYLRKNGYNKTKQVFFEVCSKYNNPAWGFLKEELH